MKKVSLLVLICMLASVVLMAFASCDEEHTHVFGKEWVMDGTNHYHVCECGAKDASAAHADANNDGACDTCGVIMAHSHVFSPVWTSDATNHWNAVLCGHDVDVLNKAAHTPDELGVCSVCGYAANVDVSTIEKSLEIAAIANKYVIGGTFVAPETNVRFDIMDGYFHAYDEAQGTHIYATENADGTVCYAVTGNNETVDMAADAKYLKGYEIELNGLVGVDLTVYGVVELISALYNDIPATIPEGTAFEMTETVADGVYKFSYEFDTSIFYMPVTLNVSVEYTLDEKYYVDNLTVTLVKDGSETTTLTFVQSDAPVAGNYAPEDITPTDVAFKNEYEQEIVFTDGTAEAIELTVGSTCIYIDAIAPENAILAALGDIAPVVKNAEGEVVAASDVYVSYSAAYKQFNIEFKTDGTFYMNITVAGKTYVIPFVATYETPTEIIPQQYIAQWSDYDGIGGETINLFTGTPLKLAAKVDEGCKPNAYTISVVEPGATVTSLGLQDDTRGGWILPYEFVATEAGTYTVVFTSTVDENVTASVTIEVTQAPNIADLAKGKWAGGTMMSMSSANFYPTDDTKGVVVVAAGGRGVSDTVIFTYYIHDGKFVATPTTEGLMIQSFGLNSMYEFVINEGVMGESVLAQSSETADTWEGDPLPEAPGYVPGPTAMTSDSTNTLEEAGTFVYTATVENGTTKFYFELSYENPTAPDGTVTITMEDNSYVTLTVENRSEQPVSATDYSVDQSDNYGFYVLLTVKDATEPQTVTVTVVYTAAK